MLLARLRDILHLNIDIADFQKQLQEAAKEKENLKRSEVLSKLDSPSFLSMVLILENQSALEVLLNIHRSSKSQFGVHVYKSCTVPVKQGPLFYESFNKITVVVMFLLGRSIIIQCSCNQKVALQDG